MAIPPEHTIVGQPVELAQILNDSVGPTGTHGRAFKSHNYHGLGELMRDLETDSNHSLPLECQFICRPSTHITLTGNDLPLRHLSGLPIIVKTSEEASNSSRIELITCAKYVEKTWGAEGTEVLLALENLAQTFFSNGEIATCGIQSHRLRLYKYDSFIQLQVLPELYSQHLMTVMQVLDCL
ncbi:hypothetical protein CC80DRAFT_32651 [Byssothecium circinans]|uniref:Uncharacterized protein n=1 Tax=Byssothecium circinans TaxID=147558 RepID=A0A6A5TXY5_9PLEO|nr:hypothetical protein CC80DRAFT_32651 [Byssothecium circinans]